MVSVNGKRVVLTPVSQSVTGPNAYLSANYQSADGKITVQLKIVASETSCDEEGMEDRCCGGFTTAMLTVRSGKKSRTLRVSLYQGG